jgi:hypothetical protein
VTVRVAALLIGYDESMKLTVVVLSALWPVLLNASSAVLSKQDVDGRDKPGHDGIRL